ncbi:PKD domain-containing protein [Flavobacteriaceae bacterium KMM 6897]|nr:PKD domain-containing protein [Flavobacteriaceae bacterium KMM 6897]
MIKNYFRNWNSILITGNQLKLCCLSFLIFIVGGGITLQAQLPNEFQKVNLLTGLGNATTMEFAPDGRIFILDRYGELLIYKTDTQTAVSAGSLSVFHELEDGLLGIAFDPNFENNNFIYLTYSPTAVSVNRVSRFEMNGDDLNLGSEIVMLEWTTSRTALYHSGGGMDFDSQGNLYVATGDNAGYDNFYAAQNESNSNFSAEKASSNTNDLRGKILRITPQPDGSYTIPAGNLFPEGTPLTRPEIYVMGARNPYRIFVDKENTDWLFWGEVGPDANNPGVLGPEGLDEMNLTKTAGNYGWPYFSGADNDAYQIPYRTPSPYYNDPAAPENTSVWNTGATVLPPARPAWLEFFHMSYFAGPRYYYDSNLSDEQRFPVEFDGMFFYYDFNSSKIWAVTLDAAGTINTNEPLAPSVFPSTKDGFIDMAMGPDGKMYILAYGAGCCPQNVGTGRLIRVDYTGITTNAPPTVMIGADRNNGSLPLVVNFSSEGTTDPNGDTPLTYEWDVDGDGNTDYTVPNPTHTYTLAGTYDVQLRVDDGNGGIGVNNITIYAGNNAANFTFNYPPDGGLMNWQDDVDIDLVVTDVEDGVIDCTNVNVIPSSGHLNHFHDELTINGCPRTLTLDIGNTHGVDGEMDIFYVLNTNFTDSGGLRAFDQIQLHPKRKEAEFFDTQNGTTIIPNTDSLEGGFEAIQVDNNGFISFSGRNLLNITSVKYKVASALSGGSIEFRVGSPAGTLLATTNVPSTGGLESWVAVETTFADPGSKNDLFFVFKNSSGTQNIFNLNYVEFIGAGVSVDNSPPLVSSVQSLGTSQVKVQFSEYVTQATAEQVSNYTIDNGIVISSAVLQSDNLSVILNVSPLSSGVTYNIQVGNVENISGQPIVTDSYPFTTPSAVRINVGGPQGTFGSQSFSADQYFTGGSLFSATIPIAETTDDELYQTERFGNFSYNIPVPLSGEYDIRLHFAELYFGVGGQSGGPGSRVFNVSIEGTPVLTNFDILSEVSPATALQKEFDNISITDGVVNIQFTASVNSPKLSAIEILSPDTFSLSANPDITILSPQNGWSVDQTFEVNFTVENWTIQEGGTHLQYSIDGQMFSPHYNYGPITIDGLSLGSHSIRLELYDVGNVATGIFHEITVNITDQGVCNSTPFPDSWAVHQLESNPYTAVYTLPDHDLDGDGLKDIVTGGWWYKNPGSASGNWIKSTIGGTFGNVVHVYDFDGDGHMDLLGTAIGSGTGNEYKSFQLLWAKNDGSGNFTVYTNIPAGNTTYNEPFLAGIAGGNFGLGSPYQMAINWNGAESTGSPVQLLTPTADPTTGTWALVDISNDSSGEDIKAGDIDGDGDLDLFQGINWLRNEGNGSWTTFSTGVTYVTTPDRVQIADFNGDGRLDAVVGQLGVGSSSPDRFELAWFEAPADPTQPWVRHILSTTVSGSLSVSAIDIDFDGDKDIVVGEWLGSRRLISFENDLCNTGNWITHILDDGALNLEHHDGAMVTDIDNDGDLDVISNGWINHKVPRIYENTTLTQGNDIPLANAGEDQSIILPLNSITLNGTGSDPDGGPVSFLWTQTSGPNTAALSGSTTADLTANNLVEGAYVFRLTVTDDENDTAFDEVGVTILSEFDPIRINSGGPQYTQGTIEWAQDQYFSGGTTTTTSIQIANTANDQLYQTERYSTSGTLVYNIPVASGTFDLNLHFAEIYFGVLGPGSNGGEGSRVFNVNIENGQGLLTNYDIVVRAGGSATAVIENFTGITVDDGNLTITLTSVVDFPKISGMEVFVSGGGSLQPIVDAGGDRTITLPNNNLVLDGSAFDPDGGVISNYLWTQVSGPNTATLSNANTDDLSVADVIEGTYIFRLTVTDDDNDTASDEMTLTVLSEPIPLRINSGGPDLDFNGELWSADQYFVGGSVSSNSIAIANTENDALYQTERFSSSGAGLTYEIPVINGTHNINLHFAEIYFGVPGPGSGGGVGSRVFHIDIENGTQRIDNYDIVVAAGGSATAVVEAFSNIEVADGSLTITLIPVTQFPKISGIEVVESRSPNADAGLDQSITLPVNTITQNGLGNDPDGGTVTFLWTQVSGPGAATLIGADTPDLTANDLISGTYVFRLTVTDDENDSSVDEVSITVLPDPTNEAPVAIASANPLSGDAPLTVAFTGSGSTDDFGIASYLWEFGDVAGSTSTEADPSFEFTEVGVYTVTLTVTDDEGLTNSTTLEITVNTPNEAPVAIATSDVSSGDAPLTVAFTGSGSTDDVSIASYLWEFGNIAGSTSTEADPSFEFTEVGVYTVTLTVTDDAGLTNSTTLEITVNTPNGAPVAVATSDVSSGDAPLTVAFMGSGSTDDVGIASYLWEFGDVAGSTSTDADPSFEFTAAGMYTVTLTVTDDDGLTNSTTLEITVNTPNGAPVAVATSDVSSGDAPLTVAFTGSGSTDDVGIASYLWEFGDVAGSNSTDVDTSFEFTAAGVYTVTLTVTDDDGLTGTATITITVSETNAAPNAVATATPLEGNAPMEVTFDGSASTDDIGIVSYTWDFGDGSTSNETNPVHTYEVAGQFDVVLTVSDGEFIDTDMLTIVVNNIPIEIGNFEFIVAPNPIVDGVINIVMVTEPIDDFITIVYLHDASGRYISGHLAQTIYDAGNYRIPTYGLRSGIYYVTLLTEKGDSLGIKIMVNN